MLFSFATLLSVCATVAVAAPRQPRDLATTCGTTHYSADDVSASVQLACKYVTDGTEAGDSDYPHEYHDYEGFSFHNLTGPFYEFPLVKGGDYDGGSPGADRVVITKDCQDAGAITHTGASGDDFVACSGTS